MHRIFCQEIPGEESVFSPEAREAEHLFKVFRARPGDAVEMLDGRGNRARGEVLPQRQIRVLQHEHVAEPVENEVATDTTKMNATRPQVIFSRMSVV